MPWGRLPIIESNKLNAYLNGLTKKERRLIYNELTTTGKVFSKEDMKEVVLCTCCNRLFYRYEFKIHRNSVLDRITCKYFLSLSRASCHGKEEGFIGQGSMDLEEVKKNIKDRKRTELKERKEKERLQEEEKQFVPKAILRKKQGGVI
jgi:hypothetical protein